jgi:pimeloyl-ACP methyl ester carboxylesterase
MYRKIADRCEHDDRKEVRELEEDLF